MYKNKISFISFLIVCLFFSRGAHSAIGSDQETIKKLESKETSSVRLPKFEKGKLDNGLTYYILPNNDLPIVKAYLYIRGGTVFDPQGRSGLGTVTSTLLRGGGTEGMDPDKIDSRLDNIASTINIVSEKEAVVASIYCRTEYFEESLDLLLDMLFKPRFDEARFELYKKQMLDSIRRRPDVPERLADVGFGELLYGKDNPWGVYSTKKSVSLITLQEVKDHYRRFFYPENMILGVVGDIESNKVLKILKSYTGYPIEKGEKLTIPKGPANIDNKTHVINKDVNQVVFNVGHEGSFRTSPDKYALIVANYILGGGAFKTRLPAIIRVKSGLAYTVSSTYGFGPEESPGAFKIFLATKTESAAEALKLLVSEFEKFSEGSNISEDELMTAKDSMLRKIIFEYDSAYDLLANIVRFNYFGYPDNYVEEYEAGIRNVTLQDVRRVAKEYFHPDRLEIVLVGNKQLLEKQLKENINIIDLTVEE